MRFAWCVMLAMLAVPGGPAAKEIFFGPNKGQEVQDTEDRAGQRHEAMIEALKNMEKEVKAMGEITQTQLNRMEEQDKLRAEMLKTQQETRDLLAAILEQLKTGAAAATAAAGAQAESFAGEGQNKSTYRYKPSPSASGQ